MKAMGFSSLLIAASSLLRLATALPTISAKGSKFFDSNGNQFYIKGIAYQLTEDDPLVNNTQCEADASLMKTLGANAIRVYHVDPTANHDDCMSTFDSAGIYLFVDMDTFDTAINSNAPSWTQTQLSAFEKVMDTFQKYDNTAGFFVGNEVLTMGNNSIAAPFVKAAARDTKAYRNSKGYRDIPIGYAAADISTLRPMLQNYLACGTNASENVDFFSLNAYEWCGSSSFDTSGYSQLLANATDYNIPIFFSETGCNKPEPRTFEDQSAIFGSDMNNTWSGAIIYEWIEETNNFGLISYGPSVAVSTGAAVPTNGPVGGFTRSGNPTPISPDFPNLSSQWATLNPTGVQMSAYSPSLTPPACPAYTSGVWEVNGNVPLPTLGQTYDAAEGSSITAGASGSGGGSSKGGVAPAPTAAPKMLLGAAAGVAGAVAFL